MAEKPEKPLGPKEKFPCKNCGTPITGYPCPACSWEPERIKKPPTTKEKFIGTIKKPQFWGGFAIAFILSLLTLQPLLDLLGVSALTWGLTPGLALVIGWLFGTMGATLTLEQFGISIIFGFILALAIYFSVSFMPVLGSYFSLLPYGGIPLIFLIGFGLDHVLAKMTKSPKWHFIGIIAIVVVIFIIQVGVIPKVMALIPGGKAYVCYLECKSTSLDPRLSPAGIDELCRKKCYGMETKKIGCTDCLTFGAEPTMLPAKGAAPERIYITLDMSEDTSLPAKGIEVNIMSDDYPEDEYPEGKPAEIKNMGVLCQDDKCELRPGDSVRLLAEFDGEEGVPCKSTFDYEVNVNYTYNVSGTLKITTRKEGYPTGGFIGIPGTTEEERSTTSAGPVNFKIGSDAIEGEYIVGIVDTAYITLQLENVVDGEAMINNMAITQLPPGDKPAKELDCSEICKEGIICKPEKDVKGTIIGYEKIEGVIEKLKKDSSTFFLCKFTLPTKQEVENSLTYTFIATAEYKFVKTSEYSIAVDTEYCEE